MSIPTILLPVFVQAGLIFFLMFWLGRERWNAGRAGEFDPDAFREHGAGWPLLPTRINNCFKNQFEVPMLFFALVPLALITRSTGLFFVTMSWLFVLSRIVHALIYTTTNDLRRRAAAFIFGLLILFVMWLMFALDILFATL